MGHASKRKSASSRARSSMACAPISTKRARMPTSSPYENSAGRRGVAKTCTRLIGQQRASTLERGYLLTLGIRRVAGSADWLYRYLLSGTRHKAFGVLDTAL